LRHTGFVRAVLALSVVAFGLACGQAGAETESAEQARRAQLVIVSTDPLVVRGLGFRPVERVKLLVTVGGRAVPAGGVRASRAGRFSVRLSASAGSSDAVVVQAIGARGSRATADVSTPTGTLAPRP
jgi:hypothetical protein